jgi:peptide/nickel transport system ATP-binding protein
MSDGAPLMEGTGLVKAYAGVPALRGVDIAVRPGEVVGLVGESGSGKSTLANCLGGLLRIDEGEVRYQGEVVARAGQAARVPRLGGVQMVFQDPVSSLNPRRTVGSTLAEILRVHRLAKAADMRARIGDALARVGLSADVAEARPSALSGGMCQRVAIARGLLMNPRVLIADEVVSSLDATVQAQVLNLLADLRDDTGVAIVFVTHDLAVVSQLCDRMFVLHRGAVVESGPTLPTLQQPSHPYTRQLLASVPALRRQAVP